jgi:hypothetical protein
MELDSFKAILLRKANGNANILELLTSLEENTFIDSVVDALEKMAKPSERTGTNANAPLTGFGANLDRTDITQLRDALGHHLSHYKAALKGHHAATDEKQKAHLRQVADQHLDHAIPLMHLAARAKAHSQGKMDIDYPPLAPWETNYTTVERVGSGRFKRDAKLLRARPLKGATRDHELSTTLPDYRYLEMAPHPGYEATEKMPHKGGYPWEEIQLGAPADIDAKKAYLHIEDIADKKDYTPHEFDKHPIRGVADIQADHMTPDTLQNFATAHAGWRSSPDHKQWLEGQKAKFTADKEGYMKRGQTKGPHFYDGIPLTESPSHTKPHAERAAAKAAAKAAAASVTAAKTPATPPPLPSKASVKPELNTAALPASLQRFVPSTPSGVTVRKPAPAAEAAAPVPSASRSVMQASTKPAPKKEAVPHPMESAYQLLSHIPPEKHETVMRGIPGLKEYAAAMKGAKK